MSRKSEGDIGVWSLLYTTWDGQDRLQSSPWHDVVVPDPEVVADYIVMDHFPQIIA